MPGNPQVVMLTFPPRELSPLERELVREWLALAGDISAAHVSARDPSIRLSTIALW
jgi:hypothetical protein